MEFFEKQVASEKKFEGLIVTVYADTVELHNGHSAYREVVEHPGGVGIVAITEDNKVLLVRQFRYPMAEIMPEIPAGKLEYGEDPYECAVRELSEETGFKAQRVVSLGKLYPSPGYCRETLYVYLATGLTAGESHPDEDEFLSVEAVDFNDACRMAEDGELTDAKTVIGLLRAAAFLRKEGK